MSAEKISTFSVGYDQNYQGCQSELPLASQIAGRIGAAHHQRVLTQRDFLDFLPRMIYLQDEPIADPVCMPVYFLSKLARDNGMVVAQAGEGADELFWGYAHWKQIVQFGAMEWISGSACSQEACGFAALRMLGSREGRATNCCGARDGVAGFLGWCRMLFPSAQNWMCLRPACGAVPRREFMARDPPDP